MAEEHPISETAGQLERYLWISTQRGDYEIAKVLAEEEGKVHVEVQGRKHKLAKTQTHKANPPKFDLVDNMAQLSHLNEPSILHNLRQRYAHNMQYTYSGLFLVAVNPYKDLGVYAKEYAERYASVHKREEAPPHIYAVASEAYHLMRNTGVPQTILITGETGAGKTENTKHAIDFLTKVSGGPQRRNSTLEQKLLCTNPLLEAFGNAKTERNDNSSRFGKFIRIDFGTGGEIVGATVERYLLEASRVTKQTPGERNYHIFYTLVLDGPGDLLARLRIDPQKDYAIMPQRSGGAAPFRALQHAMNVLEISSATQDKICAILAAVIHLSEVSFTESDGEVSLEPGKKEELGHACSLLGIDADELRETLLRPKIRAGNEKVVHSRTAQQATFTVSSLCKIVYERLFDWIVSLVNFSLRAASSGCSYIGVLDIAGFEILEKNGFEQLCINYTNEKLQQFFNHRVFVLEQEMYMREGLEWSMIDFGLDLQPTIDLFDSKGRGVFSLLDEECVVPGGTDERLLAKIMQEWKGHKKFQTPRFNDGFLIEHYAGVVKYNEPGWVVKNKDPLDEAVAALVLGPHSAVPSPESGSGSLGATRFRTVIQRYKKQLDGLLGLLYTTNPHFVRCILPNAEKKPDLFDSVRVLHQLRCNGVLEGVRISRRGFPTRVPFHEFVFRYSILSRDKKKLSPTSAGIASLLSELGVPASLFRLGKSLLFLRQGVLADLEEHRNTKIDGIVIEIQKRLRMLLAANAERMLREKNEAVILLQKNIKTFAAVCTWPWWKLCMKVRPLLEVRKTEDEIREKEKALQMLQEKTDILVRDLGIAKEQRDKSEQAALALAAEMDAHKHNAELERQALHKDRQALEQELAAAQKASVRSRHLSEALKKELAQAHAAIAQARRDSAAESTGKLIAELSELKKKLASAEEKLATKESALDEAEKTIRTLEFEKGIVQQERASAEEKLKAAAAELEEAQNELKVSEAQRYRSEVSAKSLQNETARLKSALEFEKEKLSKLDEAFKRATAPAAPEPPLVHLAEHPARAEQLQRELEEEREAHSLLKEAHEETRRQYIELLDTKLEEMLATQEEIKAENVKLKHALAHMHLELQKTSARAEEAQRRHREANEHRVHEADKRKGLEDLLKAKKLGEVELQRALVQARTENEVLASQLDAFKSTAEKNTEARARILNEFVKGVEKVLEATIEIHRILDAVQKEVAASSGALAVYRAGTQKVLEELHQAQGQNHLSQSLLAKARAEAAETRNKLAAAEDRLQLAVKEKVHMLEELENEIAAQRERFEEEESVWDAAKKKLEQEKKQLHKQLKNKSREVLALQASSEELEAAKIRIREAEQELDESGREKEKLHSEHQKTLKELRRSTIKEKEAADEERRKAHALQIELKRAEGLATRSAEKEAKMQTAIQGLEQALWTSREKERELSLKIRGMQLELSALSIMHSR